MLSKDIETINILYIEDDISYAGLTLEYLKLDKHTKFNVTQMCTLKEGLNYLENECFVDGECKLDIILLDLILPNSHGVATYKSVTEKSKNIPVVIVSAHEEMALQCVKLGAQDYLVKPHFSGKSLTRVLRYSYERGRLEREKLKLEQKYREVINHTPIGFHNYTLEGDCLRFTGYNPAAEKILNLDHTPLINQCIEHAFPGLKNTPVPEIYKHVARTGEDFSEIRDYKDDMIMKGCFKIHAFRTSCNNITVSFEDITKQIMTERKYKNLVEATNAGIFEVDYKTKKLVYVNDVLCNMLGYTKEEMLTNKADDFLSIKSKINWSKQIAALNKGKFIDRTTECQVITKDGELRWFLLTSEFLEDDNKIVYGANVVAIDITESKRAIEEAAKKEEEMFDALEERIHSWRDELKIDNSLRKKESIVIDKTLKNKNNHIEVL